MKTRIPATVLALSLAALPGCSTSPQAASPRFTHMDVALSTHDRAKDAGTPLEISIAHDEGAPAVAYLDLAPRQLPANSVLSVVVPSSGEGFSLAELKREQIEVKITPGGHGAWRYNFDAILHFSDGTEALLGSGDQALSASRRSERVPLSLATVASPSTVGMLEKFGFRLLSKTTPTEAGAGTADASAPEGAAPPGSPKSFTRMDLTLTTGDRGKDPGTRLEFFIVPAPGEPAVAYLDAEGQALSPGSTVAEVVPSAGTGFTLDDLGHEQIMVKVTPGASGAWGCKFDAVLHFANGAEALLSSGDQVLSASRTEVLIPLSLATVASHSPLGGMEKFAFRMLSKKPTEAASAEPAPPEASSAVAPGEPAAAPRFPKSFTRMDLTLATRGRGKDPGTRLEFFILPRDGEPPVAYLDVPAEGLAPDSVVSKVVPPAGAGFTLDDLRHEQIMVKIAPGGAWSYRFDAVLHFANGTEALLSSGDQSFNGAGDRALIPLSLASVASADSTMGRLEKYTFGLLSPAGRKPAADSAPKASSSKEFTEMDMALTTRNRGKDAGTRLEFFIVPKPGDPAVAYFDLQGQALDPNTTVSEVVPAAGTGFTLDELRHEQIMVRITPGGAGTGAWSYKIDVILHFANGAQALMGSGDQVLSSGNRTVLIPLSAATVASPPVVGSLEKFGFGVLNKIGH